MTRKLPPDLLVRYDLHKRPRGISAVLVDKRTKNIRAVGMSKFSTQDPTDEWSFERGRRIALGRALKNLETNTDTQIWFFGNGGWAGPPSASR